MDFSDNLATREQDILQAVLNNQYTVDWSEVTSTAGGHTAVFRVFSDALRIDGVRVNVSANLEQRIADSLDCMLLTAKLADLIYIQAPIVLNPHVISEWRGVGAACSSLTVDMLAHSQRIDADLAAKGNPGGLIATVGKHWLVDNDLTTKPGHAMNYGWHVSSVDVNQHWKGIPTEVCASLTKSLKTGQYLRMLQGRGMQHEIHHADYSQICVLVSLTCTVDGQEMDIRSLLQDKTLAPLASHEGVVRVFRQPGVSDNSITLPEVQIVGYPTS